MDPIRTVASLAPTRRAVSLWDEFKAFAFKGNVIDLAVGVIIGAAFGKIVDALVNSIMMPLIAILMPGQESYEKQSWVIGGQEVHYGVLLAAVINFLIVALALFVFISKFLGWVLHTRQQQALPPLTKEQELLTEIRDLLRKLQPPQEAIH